MPNKYERATFASLVDKPRSGAVRLEGCFAGSVVEELGKGIQFSINPRNGDTVPIVDGEPRILVTQRVNLSHADFMRLGLAAYSHGQVTVFGNYTPNPRDNYLGDLVADTLEF